MNTNETKRMWVVFWGSHGIWNIESCFEDRLEAFERIIQLDERFPEDEYKVEELRVFVIDND